MTVDETPAMACSLTAGEARARGAEIEDLFRAGLERCDREDRELRLTFRVPDVDEPALTDLVARERECCPFLDFELSKNAGRLVLVIGAPAGAGPALDVFEEYAAGRDQMPSSGSCC
jgi:hypothetical protein